MTTRRYSRRFHAWRAFDLFSGNGYGLTRRQTARLLWHHLCGMVKP